MNKPYGKQNRRATDPDADVIAAVAAGDADAFESLVKKYETRVLNTAYRYLGDATAAEDAAQEIFLKVWRGIKNFRRKSSFSTWLYRIAVNHCLNTRTRRQRLATTDAENNTISTAPGPDEQYERTSTVQIVREAISALPRKQRMALILSRFEGRSYADIAKIMDTSRSSVESLIFRAKQNLTKKLSPLRNAGAI